ncbi:MAG: hypothetical protein WD512_04110 [Candidatus Paceibacterota bacterium]
MLEKFDDFLNRTRGNKNKKVKTKDIGREGFHHFVVEEYTVKQQSNNPEKFYIIERLRRTHTTGKIVADLNKADVEYRIGYYMVGKNGRMDGKWTWGQYTPMIPVEDFWGLIDQAKKEGTIKHQDFSI